MLLPLAQHLRTCQLYRASKCVVCCASHVLWRLSARARSIRAIRPRLQCRMFGSAVGVPPTRPHAACACVQLDALRAALDSACADCREFSARAAPTLSESTALCEQVRLGEPQRRGGGRGRGRERGREQCQLSFSVCAMGEAVPCWISLAHRTHKGAHALTPVQRTAVAQPHAPQS